MAAVTRHEPRDSAGGGRGRKRESTGVVKSNDIGYLTETQPRIGRATRVYLPHTHVSEIASRSLSSVGGLIVSFLYDSFVLLLFFSSSRWSSRLVGG